MTSRTSLAQRERADLCDLLEELGPDAPTMCEGWSTRDLVGHLVVRESRPDAAVGMAVPPLAGRLRRVTDAVLADGFEAAVGTLRAGPPRFSPFALPGMDARMNTAEFFIHHEDVRRAQLGWQPRVLTAQDEDLLWNAATSMGRLATLRQADGVVLVTPDGPRSKVSGARGGGRVKVVTGAPSELLLWVSGRETVCRVSVQ